MKCIEILCHDADEERVLEVLKPLARGIRVRTLASFAFPGEELRKEQEQNKEDEECSRDAGC